MKIEELYKRPGSKYPPVKVRTTKHVVMTTSQKPAEVKERPKIVTTDTKTKSRRKIGMRVEQVARHEETSYLLDSETNQAILKNVVAKDEICRFLTPLKFIEIDTWRREVPYGLTKEDGDEKRKWRTPLEILEAVSRHDNDVVRGNRMGSADKLMRRQGLFSAPVRSAFAQRRGIPANRSAEKEELSQGLDKPRTNSSSAKDGSQQKSPTENRSTAPPRGRPSTSPPRQPILSKISNERLLAAPQRLSAVINKQRGFGDDSDAHKGYSSVEVNQGRLLYTRTPVVSTSPVRKSLNTPLSLSTSNLVATNAAKSHENIRRSASPSASAERNNLTARGQQGDALLPLRNSNERFENFFPRPSTRPHPPHDNVEKPHGTFSDPNIAYGPQFLGKKSSNRSKRDGVNYKVRNYYAAAQSTPDVISGDVGKMTTRQSWVVKKNPPTASQGDDVSTRIIYHVPEASTGRSMLTSKVHHSPWVTQALPDPTVNDKLARVAERDGYYVSRNNKSVTFHLGEPPPTPTPSTHRPTNRYVTDKISMVVVDVDAPSNLPRDGALTARVTSPAHAGSALRARGGFSDVLRHSHSIPVRP